MNNEDNPTQQLVDMMLGVINRPINQNTSFKDFKLVGPPEFKGTLEPVDAQIWISEIEKFFLVTNVSNNQKTTFATFFLKGEANYWWESTKGRVETEIVPWDRFKVLFFENYFSQSLKDRMEIKFLDLKQGDLTVTQYTAKFNELSRFAPHQVTTELRKTRRYQEGLKPQIRSKLSVLQIKTFSEILEKATIIEGENENLAKFHQDKKT